MLKMIGKRYFYFLLKYMSKLNKNCVLYTYLQERFYYSNHSKYRKYFEEWVSNLTDNQIDYFEIERNSIINQDKVKH